jgi:hypothetical protein
MSVLVCLAAKAPETVPKETLLQEVWPDTFVSESVLVHPNRISAFISTEHIWSVTSVMGTFVLWRPLAG